MAKKIGYGIFSTDFTKSGYDFGYDMLKQDEELLKFFGPIFDAFSTHFWPIF